MVFHSSVFRRIETSIGEIKTPSKYNMGLGHGLVDDFHFGLMDRVLLRTIIEK
ncbi:hypothetical protein C1646_771720 [Rhizophagus diaphanus]|nr:hypothetical protein C1646_771720 [Rhizophagus diaphanus] [Rhizophagus sp. MUCL 43196]